jgi:indolepyruvate ferredoxin oxidoreductase beta subunit
MENSKYLLSFVLAGVGGQGTILASDILSDVGLALGYEVKKAEVHGMSQRGGSVTSHVRWGNRVYSPIVSTGMADVFMGFEKAEAARFVAQLKPGGLALVNNQKIVPITVSAGGAIYPTDDEIQKQLLQVTRNVHWIHGLEVAQDLGNAKAANVVMLGALSALLRMSAEVWLEAIRARVPAKLQELNQRAFEKGWEAAKVVV